MTDEYACTWCKNGQVKNVKDEDVQDSHWQCENCDSTYPWWVYPKVDEGVDK